MLFVFYDTNLDPPLETCRLPAKIKGCLDLQLHARCAVLTSSRFSLCQNSRFYCRLLDYPSAISSFETKFLPQSPTSLALRYIFMQLLRCKFKDARAFGVANLWCAMSRDVGDLRPCSYFLFVFER
jgi:hypothetical protein